MSSITVHYILLLVKAVGEVIILNGHVCHLVEQETVSIPVEWHEVIVLHHSVATEHKAVERLCIDNRCVESLESIVLNNDTFAVAAMEILGLRCKVRDFGIDRDYTVGKLEHAG